MYYYPSIGESTIYKHLQMGVSNPPDIFQKKMKKYSMGLNLL